MQIILTARPVEIHTNEEEIRTLAFILFKAHSLYPYSSCSTLSKQWLDQFRAKSLIYKDEYVVDERIIKE